MSDGKVVPFIDLSSAEPPCLTCGSTEPSHQCPTLPLGVYPALLAAVKAVLGDVGHHPGLESDCETCTYVVDPLRAAVARFDGER